MGISFRTQQHSLRWKFQRALRMHRVRIKNTVGTTEHSGADGLKWIGIAESYFGAGGRLVSSKNVCMILKHYFCGIAIFRSANLFY